MTKQRFRRTKLKNNRGKIIKKKKSTKKRSSILQMRELKNEYIDDEHRKA